MKRQPQIVQLLEQVGAIPPSKETMERWIQIAVAMRLFLGLIRF